MIRFTIPGNFLAAVTLLLLTGVFTSCHDAANDQPAKASKEANIVTDHHTLSNANFIIYKHLDLDINVNMDQKLISGMATWTFENPKNAAELVLDTHELSIDSVFSDGKKTTFMLDSPVKYLGQPLHIILPAANTSQVSICYHTGAKAEALQWLAPSQTNDKRHPFLYTQSESIYARSWIPCPDGPGIRFTYNARVKVPKGLLALMSAENPKTTNDSSVYHFAMNIPVPAYLMALAVGDLKFDSIDTRTGVYAEPGMIGKAAYEFADAGKMVTTAEQLYGPYRWGRYDMLVLPPGFPIGGMENPRLTFVTPTVMAGDRSLVSLIAHELAHSWSGNLVTNATWNDFWMNEGFTDYFERRITEKMMGKDYADMLWELDYNELVSSVHELKDTSRDTWLKQSLDNRDPDDGFTDIPYEKGSHFLKLIEQTAGRQRFDSFLNTYFNAHAFKSVTTEDFLQYIDTTLFKGKTDLKNKININAWVYGAGIPANCPKIHAARFVKVDTELSHFKRGMEADSLVTKDWSTHEWLYFLHGLDSTGNEEMSDLDETFHFTNTGNCEIADVWFVMALKSGYTRAFPAMRQFLSRVGRRKFLEPLYTQMMQTEKGKRMAKEWFDDYRENYHPLAQQSIAKIISGK